MGQGSDPANEKDEGDEKVRRDRGERNTGTERRGDDRREDDRRGDDGREGDRRGDDRRGDDTRRDVTKGKKPILYWFWYYSVKTHQFCVVFRIGAFS